MRMNQGFLLLSFLGVFGAQAARAQDPVQEPVPNWPAPAAWSPHSESRGVSTMGAVTSPLPFIGITPCRIADTRGNGFTGAYGPPALAAGSPRSFTLTGSCAIPSTAQAASLNITVTNTLGPGFILIYPAGGSQPTVSTLNYGAAQTIANAAVVPLGTGGAITVVAGVSGTDLIIDTNGYYAPAGVGTNNTFLGFNAGNFTMSGNYNTGFGYNALSSNTAGNLNTAIGYAALASNTTGPNNTAAGWGALTSNTMGSNNTGFGESALANNSTGSFNTAIGDFALQSTTGSNNIGIGSGAGTNLTTGDRNICIGNGGVAGESDTIRIGPGLVATRIFVDGVRGRTTGVADAVPVLVDSTGQLGTMSSSARFKEKIEEMGEASSLLLKLRPVTFRYRGQAGGRRQFGLIAEEVEGVLPDLVVHDPSGQVETVLYHEMPAMLINELQKQQLEIEELKREVSALRAVISQK